MSRPQKPNLTRCINPETNQVKYFPPNVVNDKAMMNKIGYVPQPLKTPEAPKAPEPAPKAGAQDPIPGSRATAMPYNEAIAMLKEIRTEAAIHSFMVGESRPSVLKAAEKRLEELTSQTSK